MKPWIGKIFKIIISAILLIYLIRMLDWNQIRELSSHANPLLISVAPIVYLTGIIFAAIRWVVLLKIFNIGLTLLRSYYYYLIASFYGIFLPGVLGGDAIRIGLCAFKVKRSLRDITLSVFIERVAGMIALILIAGFGATLLEKNTLDLFESSLPIIFWSASGVIFAGSLAVFFFRTNILKLTGRFKKFKIGTYLTGLLNKMENIRMKHVLIVVAASFCYQAFDIMASFILALGLNIHLPFAFFMIIIPVMYLATVLPISIGGLGVREGVFVYFLTRTGISASDAVSLSFLIYMNRVITAAIGGFVQAADKRGTSLKHVREVIDQNIPPKESPS